MSLKIQNNSIIPQLTWEVAHAAFPKGNMYLQLRDEFGCIYQDEQFSPVFSQRGQPALSPWRLAWVTVMQFAENLTDRQAAEAVRSRIDWKYVLALDLKNPGFHYSVLSEFRQRLLEGQEQELLLEILLTKFREAGLLKEHGQQRTDATHVLGAVRWLNRLEIVGEALHAALNSLAVAVPDWLKVQVPFEWYELYGKHFDEYRLPYDKAERQILAEQIGLDGMYLLHCVYAPDAPMWLREIPAVDVLRRIWIQQYYQDEADRVKWRIDGQSAPSALMIASPYDTEARYSTKRGQTWVGYKVHFTETCANDEPHFITAVTTTLATDQDIAVVREIHSKLHELRLLPREHLLDTAYMAADLMAESLNRYQIELLGPMRADVSWQAREVGAFDLHSFVIDWEKREVTCPMGKTSTHWKYEKARGKKKIDTIQIQFTRVTCQDCPCRERCTRSKLSGRALTIHPTQQEYEMLQAARLYEKMEEFRERYRKRAGVEGTISLAAYTLGLRRTRYRGLEKTHFHHLATAAAINLRRVARWLLHPYHAQTRISHFAALAA